MYLEHGEAVYGLSVVRVAEHHTQSLPYPVRYQVLSYLYYSTDYILLCCAALLSDDTAGTVALLSPVRFGPFMGRQRPRGCIVLDTDRSTLWVFEPVPLFYSLLVLSK